jgi:adenosyl cobinamide kinase/adenosyl cobinamide phosphate guanylyltransferase
MPAIEEMRRRVESHVENKEAEWATVWNQPRECAA